MTSDLTCENLVSAYLESVGSDFVCEELNGRWWVVTPFRHIDGDSVELAIRPQDDGSVAVSDLGETLRHLALLGYDPRDSPRGRYLLSEITNQHRTELDLASGILFKVIPPQELGTTMQELAAASLAIGHLIYLSRSVRPATIQESVRNVLERLQVPFEQHPRVIGATGKPYTVDFRAKGPRAEVLIKALSATNPGSATGATNGALRTWFDLREDGREHSTIIDDRDTSWREPDVSILRTVSELFLWSRDEERFGNWITSKLAAIQ